MSRTTYERGCCIGKGVLRAEHKRRGSAAIEEDIAMVEEAVVVEEVVVVEEEEIGEVVAVEEVVVGI